MKKIILILIVAMSFTACKKEKLENCLIGKWYNDRNTFTVEFTQDKIKYAYGDVLDYDISNDFHILVSGTTSFGIVYNKKDIGKADCKGNNLTITIDIENAIILHKN